MGGSICFCETQKRKNSVQLKRDSSVGRRSGQERSIGLDQLGPRGLPGSILMGRKSQGEIALGGQGSLTSTNVPLLKQWHRSSRSWNRMTHVGRENGCLHDKIQD